MLTTTDPRSRRQTRAAVLESLLRRREAFRADIARDTRVTEASISRILADLRKEGIVDEERRSTSFVGRPTTFVTLSRNIPIAGIELSNDRLSIGVGPLNGPLNYVERVPVGRNLDQGEFERLFHISLGSLRQWTDGRPIGLRHAAIAVPGYSTIGANPILRWDMERLRTFLEDALDQVPVAITNSVIAQAAFQFYRRGGYPVQADHLFLFVGHGVAGVIVSETRAVNTFLPFEMGHMVMERDGAACRCGHRGCLEAYTSLAAIAQVVGIPESELLSRGDQFVDTAKLPAGIRAELRDRLFLLGLGIGNALNVQPVRTVVVSGWPSLLSEEDTAAIRQGLDESLLGGDKGDVVDLQYLAPAIGNDPQAAHSYASYCFVRGGALQPLSEAMTAVPEAD